MNYSQPNIPVTVLRCRFSTTSPVQLPIYPGSAWRGALGNALKKTVCVVKNTPCAACLIKTACAYSYVFETPPPADTEKMRKYNAAPHPFVLQFPWPNQSTGLTYEFDLVLFGHGLRYLPYLIYALQLAGKTGIGGRQQVFTLEEVTQIGLSPVSIYRDGTLQPISPAQIPAPPALPAQLEITFQTPLRIKHEGKNLNTRQLTFGAFFSTLLRRISMLSYFHTDAPLETGFAELTAAARTVQFAESQLQWYDWTRYSSRQETEMNMGGLLGTARLNPAGLEPFWPYLWLGQWTHVGKGTSMGLGAYRIN